MIATPHRPDMARQAEIRAAREAVLAQGRPASWGPERRRDHIEQSWLRCLSAGRRPDEAVVFEAVSTVSALQAVEANRALFEAGHGILDRLARTLNEAGFFALLTNPHGVVIDAAGPIDPLDRRSQLIARVGVDLSERAIGTSAIGCALLGNGPVSLHQGEHFFERMAHYSCVGMPVTGPAGERLGMLDLTGVDQPERPELVHLVAHAVRCIENALVQALPRALLVRINWPGLPLNDATDGLVALDRDGWVVGANVPARDMVAALPQMTGISRHASDLFAVPFERLFDAARRGDGAPLQVSLPSGLLLQALPLLGDRQLVGPGLPATTALEGAMPLRNLEIALIRKAVNDANGNVMRAAKALGISRATVYRKLGLTRQA